MRTITFPDGVVLREFSPGKFRMTYKGRDPGDMWLTEAEVKSFTDEPGVTVTETR